MSQRVPISDNSYGSSNEEAQRGPRSRQGTKSPNKVQAPYPRGKGKP